MADIQNTLEHIYNQNVYFDWDERVPLGQTSNNLIAIDLPILRDYSYCLNSPVSALTQTYSFFVNDAITGLTYFDKKYWIEEIKKQKDVVVTSEYLSDLDSVASVYHQVPDLNSVTTGTLAVDNFDNNCKSKIRNYYNMSFSAANSALNLEIVNLRNNNNSNSLNYTVDALSVTQMPTVKTNMTASLSALLPKVGGLTTANTVPVGDVTLENRYRTINYTSNSLSASNVYTTTLKVYNYETERLNTVLKP